MIRVVAESLGVFLLPFAFFAVWVLIQDYFPFTVAAWSRHSVTWLSAIGLALCFILLVATGLERNERTGVYVPAQVVNGQLRPGRFE